MAALLCAGCSNSNDAKIDTLAQKLDAVISNQSIINAKLDTIPKTISDIGFYYYTNETSEINFSQTNILAALDSHENSINDETRRVGVIIFTNVAGFQADTLNTLNQIKLHF